MPQIKFDLKENRVSSCVFIHMDIEVETLLIGEKREMEGL